MYYKALYFLAGAAVGAAIGAVSSYFITRNIERDRAEKEIEECRQMYWSKKERVSVANENVKKNEERKEELLNNRRKNSEPDEDDILESARVDYAAVTHDDLVKYAEILDKSGYTKYGANKPPHHVISYEEYNDERFEDYEKGLEFTYYKGDGTVLNEMGEQLSEHEIEDTVGTDFMAYFRDNPDETECFVRNDIQRLDYTVQCEEGIYEQDIDDIELEGEE